MAVLYRRPISAGSMQTSRKSSLAMCHQVSRVRKNEPATSLHPRPMPMITKTAGRAPCLTFSEAKHVTQRSHHRGVH